MTEKTLADILIPSMILFLAGLFHFTLRKDFDERNKEPKKSFPWNLL